MKTTAQQREEKRVPLLRFAQGRNDKANQNDNVHRQENLWAAGAATIGVAVWAGMAVLARVGIARIGAIELIFLFAPLVVVPLGVELARILSGGGWINDMARRIQPLGAALAVVAMWLPPGRTAGWAALGWMIVCLLLAGDGLLAVVRASWADAGGGSRALLAIAKIDLAVGGGWLVASRLGLRPIRIQEPIGLLTAVHFHFAGFATATIAAATLAFAEQRAPQPWLKRVVLVVAGLPYLVAAGFVISPGLKMGAALMFSTSVAALAVFLRASSKQVNEGTARVLLQVASGAVFASMLLSGAYAFADFAGSDALTIPQMARTHGILNAMGFCLPGLLGWLVETARVNRAGAR